MYGTGGGDNGGGIRICLSINGQFEESVNDVITDSAMVSTFIT
jgi:hypothetical protein